MPHHFDPRGGVDRGGVIRRLFAEFELARCVERTIDTTHGESYPVAAGRGIRRDVTQGSENSCAVPALLTYVSGIANVTNMNKTSVYFRQEELAALRDAARLSGRSVAQVIGDAVRKVVLKPRDTGPVAIWDGEPAHTSVEHDGLMRLDDFAFDGPGGPLGNDEVDRDVYGA